MKAIIETTNAISTWDTEEILLITTDTFGSVKALTDRDYIDCNETDKGTCLVIETHDFVNHIYPKDAVVKFK